MIEIILLGVMVLLVILFLIFFKRFLFLIVNSIIGLFALIGFNQVFGSGVEINVWSLLITGIGGILGFGIVIALHFLGLAF